MSLIVRTKLQTAEAAYQAIQQLNTYTAVGIETRAQDELDEDFLRSFSVILLNDCDEVCLSKSPTDANPKLEAVSCESLEKFSFSTFLCSSMLG